MYTQTHRGDQGDYEQLELLTDEEKTDDRRTEENSQNTNTDESKTSQYCDISNLIIWVFLGHGGVLLQ